MLGEAKHLCKCIPINTLNLFQLENSFAGPRDIEWAVADGEIYLLQVGAARAQLLLILTIRLFSAESGS